MLVSSKKVLAGMAVTVIAFGVFFLEKHLRSGGVRPISAGRAAAPDFSLPELTGDRHLTLSAYRGKVGSAGLLGDMV
jgi:hypothetical protein